MDFHRLIQEIDSEISRLQQARALLIGEPTKRGPGRPKAAASHKVVATGAANPQNVSAVSLRKEENELRTRCASVGQNARSNKAQSNTA